GPGQEDEPAGQGKRVDLNGVHGKEVKWPLAVLDALHQSAAHFAEELGESGIAVRLHVLEQGDCQIAANGILRLHRFRLGANERANDPVGLAQLGADLLPEVVEKAGHEESQRRRTRKTSFLPGRTTRPSVTTILALGSVIFSR